ncbi:MAG: OmpA family protein [Gemmatimonadales bacterium]
MRPLLRPIVIGLVLPLLAAAPLQAQFGKKLSERIKQNAAERKRQTEENLVARAAEPADSAMERIAAPVDSVAARAASKAGKAVSIVGRGAEDNEEARIREELTAGRAELAEVGFEPGSDAITPDSEPTLTALAKVLAGWPGMFLIQARADAGASAKGKDLAGARAAALKNWLLERGVPEDQLYAVGDGVADEGGSLATVVRMQ